MASRILERRFAARAEELRGVRDAVRSCVLECGAPEKCAEDVVIAVDEACQNVIRHAYSGDAGGEIVLEIDHRGDHLEIRLTDFAPPIDRSEVKPRALDEIRPGGIGTHFIQEVMDSAEFVQPPPGCGNLLRMVKRLG